MATPLKQFEYQVCYGVADRVTFANGTWLGDDIPEAKRKQEDIQTCPLMWEFLGRAGAQCWETDHTLGNARGTKRGAERPNRFPEARSELVLKKSAPHRACPGGSRDFALLTVWFRVKPSSAESR